MFQLTQKEYEVLRSQIAILKTGRGQHRKYMPRAFTEQGIAMLLGVLSSDRAITVNIQIMRAFIKLRETLASHIELRKKIETMKAKYDKQFKIVFDVIKQLITQEEKPKAEIGFKA